MKSKVINKWMVLTVMCLLTVMLNIDATAVNLAIPVIAHEFHAQLSTMQWVMGVFLLGSASFQIIGGRVGDVLGNTKLFNIGTLLFIAASAICGFSENPGLLLTGRALQGIALGIANPMTLAIVFRIFPDELKGTAMGIIIGVMGFSLAVGPTIGGAFVDYLSWHWIFFVNVPIGLLTLLLSWRYCPADVSVGAYKDIDYLGALILMTGLTLLILAFNQVEVWGFSSGLFLGILAAGIVLLIILGRLEKRTAQPIMEYALFKLKNYSLYNFVRFMSQMVFLALLFFLPLYLVNVVELSAFDSGMVLLALTVVVGICSPLAGKWVDKSGAKYPTVVSLVCMMLGAYLLTRLQLHPEPALLYSFLVVTGLGIGINFTSTVTGGLAGIDPNKLGLATGVYFTVIWTSCAFAIAFAGAIVAVSSHAALAHQLSGQSVNYSVSQLDLLTRAARGLVPVSALQHFFLAHHVEVVIAAVRHSFMVGLHALGWALFAVSGLGLIGSLLVTDVRADGSVKTQPS